MPRQERPDPKYFRPFVDSFALSLRAAGKSEKTVEIYTDAALWFGGWMVKHHPKVRDWADIERDHLRRFFVELREAGYSKSYCNQLGRSLQAFFKWFTLEEAVPNPFDGFKPPTAPKLGELPPPIIAVEQLAALVKDAERGRDFESRRDAALLRLFASTGCRLSEVALLQVDAVNVAGREATVTGKGSKVRTVKYDHKAALALDRYLRIRARHPAVVENGVTALWIGVRRRMGMTASGVRQVIERRGEGLGLDIHPHLFRHTFAHNWLDAGGAEGDLMELAGWDSAQMLRHYGRSARSARARRAYDRVDVMRGV
jgi:site-specific recombinase XerD